MGMYHANLRIPRVRTKELFLFVFFFLYFLPITMIGGDRGGLPIDIVPSDVLAIFVALVYIFSNGTFSQKNKILILQIILLIYGFGLVALVIIQHGDILPLFSFFKFSKTIFPFIAGYALTRWLGQIVVLRALSNSAVAFIFLLALSQFAYHFNFRPRLGSHFFELEVYGFPNSAASYYVFLLCCALIVVRTTAIRSMLFVLGGAFALGSLSRNALLIFILAVIFFNLKGKVNPIRILVAFLLFSLIYFFLNWVNIPILTYSWDAMVSRMENAQYSNDISNGRFEIFSHTFDLISTRPLFGYGFQAFSQFSQYGTPHNQYLELLFKVGVFGTFLYLSILYAGILQVFRHRASMPPDLSLKGFYIIFGIIFVGSLAQPNFSYSPTGNLLFLIFGIFSYSPRQNVKKIDYCSNSR